MNWPKKKRTLALVIDQTVEHNENSFIFFLFLTIQK